MFNNYTSLPTSDSTGTLLTPDSIEFIPELIMSLPNSKSPGPDGWLIVIIKSVSEFTVIPLSIIIKKSFNSRNFPHDWKNALITPIHKKCARNQTCNYCPVSLTSIFSKFMESIIKDHITSHLLTNKLLSDYQFGFVPGRSCAIQLLHVLDYFTNHLNKGESVDVIYLGFQKAFDSVSHQRLI